MPPMQWSRSLYARIALGFIAFLAVMLVVQALLFVWLVSRSGRTLPGESPIRLAQAVALDLSDALVRNPAVNLTQYVREQYSQYTHPFFVMLSDGTLITSGSRSFPEPMLRAARIRLQGRPPREFERGERGQRSPLDRPQLERPPAGPQPDRPQLERPPVDRSQLDRAPLDRPQTERVQPERPVPDRQTPGRPPFERPPARPPLDRSQPERQPSERPERFLRPDLSVLDPAPQYRFVRPAPIFVNGRLAGVVVVPPTAPFGYLLARFAPMLSLVAVGVLIVGTALASILIFGPPRRRLRALEDAARRLGAGDLSARAPDRGGDEIAAVASAFNSMADDLAARADALAASDRVRRQLLADVSHELTTPITAMRGYLETLTMPEMKLDAATRGRYLGIVGDETARLERIIGDLLDLARLEGGGGSLTIEPVPISQLFERVAARHERTCEQADVAMQASIEPGAEIVMGDQNRLEQALQNLAANAIRYAPRGSTVRLTAQRTGDGVTISVEDEGPGIAAEHLPHIFDRFYKADESRASQQADGGSGLGLSIVKAIVERHGGRVSVSSQPGRTVIAIAGLSPGA